jgi:protein-L-isoaspartate(D-aspartate) O-methyltransferase
MTSQRARNRLVDQLRNMGVSSERVLEVIRTVPRHLFIDEALGSRAYENTALPIGYGQTISQPYTVAIMTALLLETGTMKKALEIGAGCGYQTAVLSHFCDRVYSVERIKGLFGKTENRLRQLKHTNARMKYGDGFAGWAAYAPYDAILVAAAPVDVPEQLLHQLAIGGRLIIPIGIAGQQKLRLFTRSESGVSEQSIDDVSFVPLLDGTL